MTIRVILKDEPFAEELKPRMLQVEGEGMEWRFKYGNKPFPRVQMSILGTRHETSDDNGAPYHKPYVLVEDLIQFIRARVPGVIVMTRAAYEDTFNIHFNAPQVSYQLG